MAKLYNLARVTTATVGTGTITLGAAVPGFLTFALAGALDGNTVAYGIRDGNNSEVGVGVYNSAGPTLTRGVIKSTNADALISLTGSAEVAITVLKEQIGNLTEDNVWTGDQYYAAGKKLDWNSSQIILRQTGSTLSLEGAAAAGTSFIIQNTDDGTQGGVLAFLHNSATPAASDTVGQINFTGKDSGGNNANYALIRGQIALTTDPIENGALLFSALQGGANLSCGLFGSSASFSPNVTDTISLGTSAVNWSDLFLDAGGVINFDSGDATFTHIPGQARVQFLGSVFNLFTSGANAFAIGPNGLTNPVFRVNASAASVATGIVITGAAAGSAVSLAAISSGADERLNIDGKGAGTVRFGATSTGAIEFSRNAVPTTSDGAALGTTALMWSDLFLASGATINFNNGNITLTHSSNNLNMTGVGACQLTLQNTSDGAAGSNLALFLNTTTPATNDIVGTINFLGTDTSPAIQEYARIEGTILDPTSGAEFGNMNFRVLSNAALKVIQINGTNSAMQPAVNDAWALGTATLSWSDLFLASGGVINFNNGNVTATHSAAEILWDSPTSGFNFRVGAATGTAGVFKQITICGSDNGTGAGGIIQCDMGAGTTFAWGLGNRSALLGGAFSRQTLLAGRDGIDFGIGEPGVSHNTYMTLSTTALTPFTNDLIALGTTTLKWADLFLASGAVINFNSGDVLITHVANELRFTGASVGYSVDAVFFPATNDGAALGLASNGFSDLFLASGAVINFNNGDVTLTHSTDTLTVAGGTITLAAGTTAIAPLKFQSGTNLTTAADGAMEFDGLSLFFTPDASDRRILPAVAFIRQHATFTLTSTTAYQKLFNGSANGAITLPIGTYFFECMASLDTMSATSGNAAFGVNAGTATIVNSILAWSAIDAAVTGTGGAAFQGGMVRSNQTGAAATNMATAATTTEMQFWVRGSFEVSVAGTVIPQIALLTAAAAVVKIGSYFLCWRAGADTATIQGNWS